MKPSDLETIHKDPVTACIEEIMEAGVTFGGGFEEWTITICHPVMRIEVKASIWGLAWDKGEPVRRDCDGTPAGWTWDRIDLTYTMASKYTKESITLEMSKEFGAAIRTILADHLLETLAQE